MAIPFKRMENCVWQSNHFSRRDMIAAAVALSVPTACHAQTNESVFKPEDYGARGDGITNDTAAFAALSKAVNQNGGGTVVLRKTVYVVGAQRHIPEQADSYLLMPQPILAFSSCASDVLIEGNGATLRSAAGLRYGVFDPQTRAPAYPALPYYQREGRAVPYEAMIHVDRCRGRLMVRDLVLDGNADKLVFGGRWGDTGWQLAGSGIVLLNNVGDELIENVTCRNHPLDGIMIDGVPYKAGATRRLVNVITDRNGRQGCSIVGGGGYVFDNCRFQRTGRGPIGSAPGAGVDVEPENGKQVSHLRFNRCRFDDNAGPGLLASGIGSSDVACALSTFIGTTAWAAWPNAPRYSFDRCTFIGASSNCYGSRNATDATQFIKCSFRDTLPDRSSRIFLGGDEGGPIVDVSTAANVRFKGCTFSLTGAGRLPWSTAAIYENCSMVQRTALPAYPRGKWVGRSIVRGKVDVGGSTVIGSLSINGAAIPSLR